MKLINHLSQVKVLINRRRKQVLRRKIADARSISNRFRLELQIKIINASDSFLEAVSHNKLALSLLIHDLSNCVCISSNLLLPVQSFHITFNYNYSFCDFSSIFRFIGRYRYMITTINR